MTIPWQNWRALGLLAPLLGACATDTVCILEPDPTIRVTVLDAETGRAITDSASGFVTLGARRSDLIRFEYRVGGGATLILASFEQTPGSYQVVVTRPGYDQFAMSGIQIEKGHCFSRGPALTVPLNRRSS